MPDGKFCCQVSETPKSDDSDHDDDEMMIKNPSNFCGTSLQLSYHVQFSTVNLRLNIQNFVKCTYENVTTELQTVS